MTMRTKFPTAASLLDEARQAERKKQEFSEEIRRGNEAAESAARAQHAIATKVQAAHALSLKGLALVSKLIDHNGGKSIIDGMGYWERDLLGRVSYREALTLDMVELPEEMRELPDPINVGDQRMIWVEPGHPKNNDFVRVVEVPEDDDGAPNREFAVEGVCTRNRSFIQRWALRPLDWKPEPPKIEVGKRYVVDNPAISLHRQVIKIRGVDPEGKIFGNIGTLGTFYGFTSAELKPFPDDQP